MAKRTARTPDFSWNILCLFTLMVEDVFSSDAHIAFFLQQGLSVCVRKIPMRKWSAFHLPMISMKYSVFTSLTNFSSAVFTNYRFLVGNNLQQFVTRHIIFRLGNKKAAQFALDGCLRRAPAGGRNRV
jgi:hypothetical protein